MNKKKKIIMKIAVPLMSIIMSTALLGFDVLSIIDFSAGESGLIKNEMTPYSVDIVADGQTVAVVPVGIGVRGDADNSGNVSLYDAIEIAKYLIGKDTEKFENSFGFMMADTNLSGKVDLYDAINVAKYLITKGTHEEKWEKILAG